MNNNATIINSPVRHIAAKVELYEGSTLVNSYTYSDELISIDIVRIGDETKFFGYGVCQKANIQLRDVERKINITTANSFKIYFKQINIDDYISNFPTFYVSEVHRDENTNQLSITAYDALYNAANHTVSELGITDYNVIDFTNGISQLLGIGSSVSGINLSFAEECFTRHYAEGANFEGTETLRAALDAIAENIQAIYYVTAENSLMLKRLDISGEPALTIGKADYITLQSKENRRLTTLVHATELGDNVSVNTGAIGSTQYVRDNPFWDLRNDIDSILNNAIEVIGGLTINQFTCSWRGNYLLDIGDKIAVVTKDDNTIISYVLNDTISYTGGLTETTSWNYAENETETAANPSTIGDALKQTVARVDKVNKEITLRVESIAEANEKAISTLQVNTDGIALSVEELIATTNNAIEGANESIADLYDKVALTMSAEDVNIAIQSLQEDIDNGVDKVQTSTGFTFNEEGLTIEKTDREMKTQITENGMTVYKNNEAILTANNVGVDAVNLHATTYLIIGNNSRFEDMGSNRTGCFWIGG